ncbi:hypothetical protein ACFL6S_27190 [Candidatus Poribacteria bacterium]
MRQCVRKDIPYNLDAGFDDWALQLRNKLLMFRFQNLRKVEQDMKAVVEGIEPRLNQIMIPLASIVEEADFRMELGELLRQYQSEILADRGTRWEAEVIEAILKLRDTKVTHKFAMSEIADVVNENQDEGSEQISARKVGSIVRRSLCLKVIKIRNRNGIEWEPNQAAIASLAERYGLKSTMSTL